MNKIKLACITYKKLSGLTRESIQDINDDRLDIRVIDTSMVDLAGNISRLLEEDIDVFVAGGAYAEIIKATAKRPVVTIEWSSTDLIKSILKAKKYGRKIAIASYEPLDLLESLDYEQILDVDLSNLVFDSVYDLSQKLQQKKFDALVGGSVSNQLATEHEIPSVLIYKGKKSVTNAIKEAKQLATALYEEKKNIDLFQSIFNYTPIGMIVLNENGTIASMNSLASTLCQTTSRHALGKEVQSIIPDFDFTELREQGDASIQSQAQVNQRSLFLETYCIRRQDKFVSAVIMLKSTEDETKQKFQNRRLPLNKTFQSKMRFSDILGDSPAISNAIRKAKKFSRSHSTIHITGKTGVGKEMFAQSIHDYSFVSKGPFVAVNCAALPENLLESELFGYEEGAFTGSRKGGKKGLFEIANGGTVFLDEIGEISLSLQARLLRVLQEREIIRVGGETLIPVNVRVISASNKDLETLVPDQFREDLFYRLAILSLEIPPLHERGADVVELFRYFFEKYSNQNKSSEPLSVDSLTVLQKYSWPGNIRQLNNVAERFCLEIEDFNRLEHKRIHRALVDSIGLNRLIRDIFKQHGIMDPSQITNEQITTILIDDLEVVFPKQKERIAQELGISRTSLWRKLKE